MEKINIKLFTSLGLVHTCIMKNSDLRLENAALGLQSWATFSRSQSVKVKSDHRSKFSNLSNWKEEA